MRSISAVTALSLAIALPGMALAQGNPGPAPSDAATTADPAARTTHGNDGASTGTAKANINTSRSNTKGVAPPAPDGKADEADAAPANINTSRSNTKDKKAPQ